jgi:uncharacterized protein (DUF1501 family)
MSTPQTPRLPGDATPVTPAEMEPVEYGLKSRFGRRAFIVGLGAAGAAAAGAAWGPKVGGGAIRRSRLRTIPAAPSDLPAASNPERALVVLEMAGGNDGFSMLVPYADPTYASIRQRTSIDPATVLRLDNEVGLHPSLTKIHAAGAAWVQGIGVAHPDLSHFEMLRRWWLGDPDGVGAGPAHDGTGFLGRLCDAVGDMAAPAVGVSLGTSPTPALIASRVSTTALATGDGTFPVPGDDAAAAAWRAAWNAMAHPDRADAMARAFARRGARQAMDISAIFEHLPPENPAYPQSDLAASLALGARVLAASAGVRVLHVPVGGDFDTHSGHRDKYGPVMDDFDGAVGAFLDDLNRRGLGPSTVVMTVSEFGRRAADNGTNGLDHGTASVAMIAGAPVRAGRYGRYPSLSALDDDGNVSATVGMVDYYATVAAWMGADPAALLPGSPTPIGGLLT